MGKVGKITMPKNRKSLEDMLMNAFESGMISGYAVDHEHLSDDETVLQNRYKAFIQGKIGSTTEIYNGELTTCEKICKGIRVE